MLSRSRPGSKKRPVSKWQIAQNRDDKEHAADHSTWASLGESCLMFFGPKRAENLLEEFIWSRFPWDKSPQIWFLRCFLFLKLTQIMLPVIFYKEKNLGVQNWPVAPKSRCHSQRRIHQGPHTWWAPRSTRWVCSGFDEYVSHVHLTLNLAFLHISARFLRWFDLLLSILSYAFFSDIDESNSRFFDTF